MPKTTRKYTFRVTCPLPPTAKGEAKSITTFIYDAKNATHARRIWFTAALSTARRNGLLGTTAKLRRSLELIIERQNKRALGVR